MNYRNTRVIWFGLFVAFFFANACSGGASSKNSPSDLSTGNGSSGNGGEPTSPGTGEPASFSIPIAFEDTQAIARAGDVVTFGLPIAKDQALTSVESLGLFDESGAQIPAQFTVTSRFGGEVDEEAKPIRFLLIEAPITLDAGEKSVYTLNDAGGPLAPTEPVSVTETSAAYTVDTGPASFVISKTHFNIFDSVNVGGKLLISSRSSPGIEVTALDGKTYSSGEDSVVLSSAIEREGPVSTLIRVSGRFPQDFADEFWVERFVAQYAGVSDAACAANANCARTVDEYIEKNIVMADWLYPADEITGPREIEYTVWFQFFAGESTVKTWVRFENHNTCPVRNSGGIACAEEGSLESVGVEDFSVVLRADMGKSRSYRFSGDEGAMVSGALSKKARLYQDSSGTDLWDIFSNPAEYADRLPLPLNDYYGDDPELQARDCAVYKDSFGGCQETLAPRLAGYVDFRGYHLDADEGGGYRTADTGDQATGLMVVGGDTSSIGVGLQNFWQNFPKAFELKRREGDLVDLRVGLFPSEFKSAHFLRAGEKKTHVLIFSFGDKSAADDMPRHLSATLHPIVPHAKSAYYAGTQAFDYMTPFDVLDEADFSTWSAAFVDLDLVDSVNSAKSSGYPSATAISMREGYDRYGYKEFGDIPPGPQSYENILGTDFHKYEVNLGELKRALAMDGENAARFLELSQESNRQIADFGILDVPYTLDTLRQYGFFGQSAHDQAGISNWIRANTIGSPYIDTFFDAEGLLAGYHMTGEPMFRETALKLAQVAQVQLDNITAGGSFDDEGRAIGNGVRILIAAYRETHEASMLESLDALIRAMSGDGAAAFGNAWLSCPCAKSDGEIKVWGASMGLLALGQYLDLLVDEGLEDKPEFDLAKSVLVDNAKFFADHVLFYDKGYLNSSGKFTAWPVAYWTVPYSWQFDGNTGENGNYSGSYAPYYLMTVDGLTYAAKYSGAGDLRDSLFEKAKLLYRGGGGHSFDPTWPIGLFTHLGEMRLFTTYGDVLNYYQTYGFEE